MREGVPEAVELFYEYVKPVRRKLRRDLRLRAEVSEAITKVMRGVSPASDVVNLIARRSYPHFSGFTELESKEILVSLVREMF